MDQLKNKLIVMLEMQAATNHKVNKDWIALRYPFLRAVVIEAAEAMDHWGWKWWKKQTPDLDQFNMELVDIIHFALSHYLLQADGNVQGAADVILGQLQANDQAHFEGKNLLEKLDLLIGQAAFKHFSFPLFLSISEEAGMNFTLMYKLYLSKNVLNFFRQDHGYATGTYRKVWGEHEDNVHLSEIVKDIDFSTDTARDDLYEKLSARYASFI